jgi:hypothetical protein
VATVATLLIGLDYVFLWEGLPRGPFGIWLTPSDLWGTYLASISLVHGHLTSAYAALPGSLIVMAPAAALGNALHLEVGPNFAAFAAPNGWLLVGPYTLVLAAIPLFAADAIAEQLGSSRRTRLALALLEAIVLANVTIKWGHPEDAISGGLMLFAARDVANGRWRRAGWLLGAAIAVQPFAVLALPALITVAAVTHRRQAVPLFVRSVVPIAVLLLPALVFDWHEATQWIIHQPNFPYFNHLTPWTSLATRIPGRFVAVSAGPGRLIGVAVATALSVVVCRRHAQRLEVVLWAIEAAFFLWLAVESVMDSYYTWPVLALGLLLCARRKRWRLAAAGAVAIFVTWFSNVAWTGIWPWWIILMAGLLAMLALSWPGASSSPSPADPSAAQEHRQPAEHPDVASLEAVAHAKGQEVVG